MAPMVNTEDLTDARGVAELLGLSHANSVSLYQRRYPDTEAGDRALGRSAPELNRRISPLWGRP